MDKGNLTREEVAEQWKHVHDNLIHWYGVADSKSMGVITINGLLFSFVALGSIIGIETETTTTNKFLQENPATFYSLVAFLNSIIISVVFSIAALWARVEITPSIWPSIFHKTNKKPIGIPKRYDLPSIFFINIADTYPIKEEKYAREEGERFFYDEIFKYKSAEEWLKALALEIVILSTNLKKKYILIDLSYLGLIASLGLMLITIILNYVL